MDEKNSKKIYQRKQSYKLKMRTLTLIRKKKIQVSHMKLLLVHSNVD